MYGKILEITRQASAGNPVQTLKYTYDAQGNRISKTVRKSDGTSSYTWYVRDAQGNVMTTYESAGGVSDLSSLFLVLSERHLYGSSRLGVYTRMIDVDNTPKDMGDSNSVKYYRGYRQYELSNHLGNVLATISDKKRPHAVGGNIDYYAADIVTAQDYYPFGMQMPGRWRNISYAGAPNGKGYRYGFNGKEKDDEVKGSGNQYDYGFRIYDPRLGRFLSVDPLTKEYPWYTPYQYAGNKPIAFIDRDGLEEARPDEKRAAWLRPMHAYTVKQNAQTARDASKAAKLPDAGDGQWDAFRHTYWNALNARDLGEQTSAFFPTLHETGSDANNPNSPQYDPVAVEMDLFNNAVGRKIGAANPNATDAELAAKVMEALNAGELKVIKIETVNTPEGEVRTPTNANGQPIQNNTEKVLTGSAPKKTDSRATKAEKSKLGYDKKSKEYTNPNPMPVK